MRNAQERRLKNREIRKRDRAVKTLYKVLKHEEIDNYKKDGWTFALERRSGKYQYLYRQKKIKGKKYHFYVAKNWEDLENKIYDRAQKEVYGEEWAGLDLTKSEMETLNFISGYLAGHSNQRSRDPLIEKYRKQLKMTYSKKSGVTSVSGLSVPERKNTLRAARKAFNKRRKIIKKIIQIAKPAKTADSTIYDFLSFARTVVKESGKRSVKGLKNYLRNRIEQDDKCLYAILRPSEIRGAAEVIIYISKYSEMLP